MREEGWFNKPVFLAMGLLTLASTITSCTLIQSKATSEEYVVINDRGTITSVKETVVLVCEVDNKVYTCNVRDK